MFEFKNQPFWLEKSEKLNSKRNLLSIVQFEPVLWQNEHFDP